jgi:predicted short-subunit dehydrogenase-like oxidoreductase (DUF2520 family)
MVFAADRRSQHAAFARCRLKGLVAVGWSRTDRYPRVDWSETTMHDSPEAPLDIVLIGAGRVGTAVAHLLKGAHHNIVGVGFAGRDSTRRAAELLAAPPFGPHDLPAADVVLIGVPHWAIAAVTERCVAQLRRDTIVCHFAGVAGLAPLRAATDAGLPGCAMHPVQACPDVDAAIRRLPGCTWGVTCSDGLERWTTALIRDDLKGRPVFVPESDRPLWHAASVTTANGIAALLASAEMILRAIGITEPMTVLEPLATGAVTNAHAGGGGAATLTGPLVRGERHVIELHLHALKRAPDAAEAYRAATRVVLEAARRAGRIDAATDAAMTSLLDERDRSLGPGPSKARS